jgi:Spy/CpxP family protein refolding chaperone
MDKNRFAKQVAVAAGVCFLCGFAAGPTLAQNSPAGQSPQTPQTPSRASQPKKDPRQADVFEGLEFTEEQKAKISAIQRDVKSRMDAVAKDDKLNQDQKDAMLQGYRRLENGEIFKVLTPEQQAQVRKHVQALHKAQQKQQQNKPAPTPQ